MNYLYYPGCSLEGTAREYDYSTRALMAALGARLTDIPDWVCCGATAAEATSRLLSLALPAINLAIADRLTETHEILVPCSACYLNLKRAAEKTKSNPALLEEINEVLQVRSLRYGGGGRVRHLLDVLSRDVGAARIAAAVKHPLHGLTAAPYYGCQCLRPYVTFDDPETPRSMDPLLEAVGASVHPWTMGGRCCGAANMNTKPETAFVLVNDILRAARGADVIVTVCPMCQMNLEGYQAAISERFGENRRIPVLYLPQLIGAALGIPLDDLKLRMNLSVSKTFLERMKRISESRSIPPSPVETKRPEKQPVPIS